MLPSINSVAIPIFESATARLTAMKVQPTSVLAPQIASPRRPSCRCCDWMWVRRARMVSDATLDGCETVTTEGDSSTLWIGRGGMTAKFDTLR